MKARHALSRIIEIPQTNRVSDRHLGEEDFFIDTQTNGQFLSGIVGPNLHFASRTTLATVNVRGHGYNVAMLPFYRAATTSLMVQTLHGAFSGHKFFSLRPETCWYMIVHEIAQHVKLNSGHYAHLFTTAPEKRLIHIQDDHLDPDQASSWMRTIELVGDKIREIIGSNEVTAFLPYFSTTTKEDVAATLVALMDTISPYYDIQIGSVCHIPQIRLEGTPDDWAMLIERTRLFRGVITGLYPYFNGLLPVLVEIEKATRARTVNLDFWRSIYKYDSSSGDEWITGWITAFLAHIQTSDGPIPRSRFDEASFTVNQFPSHVSAVPFTLYHRGQNTPMVFAGGITGVDHQDGFLVPRLGLAVASRYAHS